MKTVLSDYFIISKYKVRLFELAGRKRDVGGFKERIENVK